MSTPATQVATPAAPAAAPPVVQPAPNPSEGGALDAAFAELAETPVPEEIPAEAAAETPEAPETETPEEPAQKPPEQGKGKKAKVDLAALTTDAALATPEGVKTAAAAIRTEHRRMVEGFMVLDKKEKKFERTKTETLAERQNVNALAGMLQNAVQAMRSGDAETRIKALGTIAGRDGIEELRELNIALARNGKKPELTPEVQALQGQLQAANQRIEQLAGFLQQREEVQRGQARAGSLQRMAADASARPQLARFIAENPEHTMSYIIDEVIAAGGQLDDVAILDNIERELQAHYAPQGVPAQPESNGNSTQSAKPEGVAQRPPGRSLNPSLATQRGAQPQRALSEAEQMAQLREDPAFWKALGLPGMADQS